MNNSNILSPCIGVCSLVDDMCSGCFRTSSEISNWMFMSDEARTDLMENVLPDREIKFNEYR